MGNAAPNVNSTWLVFCYPGIDPDRISAILELPPTESKSGLVADATVRTPLGLWKLALPPLDENETVED